MKMSNLFKKLFVILIICIYDFIYFNYLLNYNYLDLLLYLLLFNLIIINYSYYIIS